jgi:hypothetical protein
MLCMHMLSFQFFLTNWVIFMKVFLNGTQMEGNPNAMLCNLLQCIIIIIIII